jgi:hypothetical protein
MVFYVSENGTARYDRKVGVPRDPLDMFVVRPVGTAPVACELHSLVSAGRSVYAVDTVAGTVTLLTLTTIPWEDT